MTVWRDGEVGSGSSGSSGGGSVGISREWQEAYSVDFSTLPDQDLKALGNGDVSIDDKVWNLKNEAAATAVDVGTTPGGLKITVNPAVARRLYQLDAITACILDSPVLQYFVGTEAEGRYDIDIRFSFRFSFAGSPGNTYEGICHGMTSNTLATNRHHYIHQGSWTNVLSTLARYRTYSPGTGMSGSDMITESTLGYYPNCSRLSFLGDVSLFEYSDEDAESLSVAVWEAAYWKSRSVAQKPILSGSSAVAQHRLFFGIGNYYGSGGISSVTLHELVVEWKNSDTSVVVLV